MSGKIIINGVDITARMAELEKTVLELRKENAELKRELAEAEAFGLTTDHF